MGALGVERKIARKELVQAVPVGADVDQVTCLHHLLHRSAEVVERVRRVRGYGDGATDEGVRRRRGGGSGGGGGGRGGDGGVDDGVGEARRGAEESLGGEGGGEVGSDGAGVGVGVGGGVDVVVGIESEVVERVEIGEGVDGGGVGAAI